MLWSVAKPNITKSAGGNSGLLPSCVPTPVDFFIERLIMETQKCFKCSKVLPLSEFYKHKKMGNGHIGKCKTCTKVDVQEYRRDNIEKIRKYDNIRSKLSHRKINAIKILKTRRKTTPQKNRANAIAGQALKSGKIKKRPCYFCESNDNIEMHHPDYTKPLRVYFLCRSCHRKLDGMNTN